MEDKDQDVSRQAKGCAELAANTPMLNEKVIRGNRDQPSGFRVQGLGLTLFDYCSHLSLVSLTSLPLSCDHPDVNPKH